ncbi:hypothetical protein ACRARG_09600 [Pseudooceanicola sp. C21-150M6]|uniref:hypothetical protein n=1 Tax=Pseudooceanicola sp. C21-150M6 TaxID=3434355 RepID=UPI003D7FF836
MTRSRAYRALLLFWTALWLGSFLWPALLAPAGDGFLRGMNRLGTFLILQIAAGCLAPVLLLLRPPGAPRWIAILPVALALLMALAILTLIVWPRGG